MALTNINVSGARLSNVAAPTADTDAANKQYVDNAVPNITAGNGIDVSEKTVSVKAKADGGIIVDESGVSIDPATMPVPEDSAPTDNPTFTGNVTVPTPTENGDAANKEYVDSAVAAVEVTGGNGITASGMTVSVKAKPSGGIVVDGDGVSVDTSALDVPTTENPTFTGNVTVPEPTEGTDAANKDYVDQAIANVTVTEGNGIAVDGNIVSVKAKASGGITVDADGVSVNSTELPFAPTENPTFTGKVTVPAPTDNTDAATKEYVDSKVSTGVSAGNGVQIVDGEISVKAKADGGIVVDGDGVSVNASVLDAAPTENPTFTGNVTVPAPTTGTDAANKDYVDQAVAGVGQVTAGNGLQDSDGTLSVKAADATIVVDESGVKVNSSGLPYLPLSGGNITGNIEVAGAIIGQSDFALRKASKTLTFHYDDATDVLTLSSQANS